MTAPGSSDVPMMSMSPTVSLDLRRLPAGLTLSRPGQAWRSWEMISSAMGSAAPMGTRLFLLRMRRTWRRMFCAVFSPMRGTSARRPCRMARSSSSTVPAPVSRAMSTAVFGPTPGMFMKVRDPLGSSPLRRS